MTISESGVVFDLPEQEYHADPTAEGSLSYSGAKVIIDCPERYIWQRENRVEKPEYDFGHVAHTLVLGAGVTPWIVDAENWRTKAAQDAQKQAHADGLAPILRRDFRKAVAMRAKIREHPLASRLFATGRAEVSMFARDPETRIMMRARADWLTETPSGRPLIVDYKTVARTANPERFGGQAFEYGYDIQDAWYRTVAHLAGLDDPAFLFVIQEKSAPYLVSVIELSDEARETGAQRARSARHIYLDCRTRDTWPGYPTHVHRVALPGYATAPIIESEFAS